MTAPLFNNLNGAFANVVDGYVYPQFLFDPMRAPTSQDIYPAGTRWLNNGVSPAVIYETTGAGNWNQAGGAAATTTTFGSVLLTDNSQPVATKAYADALAIAGAPVATTTTSGIGRLVSDANAIARIASTGAQAYFIQPSNLTAVLSSPGPIGNTIASTGAFTTLSATSTTTLAALALTGTANINVSGAAITTIGTGGTGIVAIGNTTGNTAVTGSLTASTSLTATLGNITATNGNIVKGTAGNKDIYSSVASTTTAGANSAGKVTLVGGTATISTTAITANSIVRLTRQSVGATGAAALGMLSVGTIVAGTSFVINAWSAADATALAATDVSSIGWEIVN